MKLIIDIPESSLGLINDETTKIVYEAIRNGTVLPKGHGDLIDRKELLSHTKCTYKYDCQNGSSCDKCSDNCIEVRDVENATTVIEADKENRE